MSGRRLVTLVLVLSAIAIPAAVLRVLCVGNSCSASAGSSARVPFCSLADPLRSAIAAGFREGRSPDVLAVTRGTPVFTEVHGLRVPWPATGTPTDMRVPLVFAGPGVATDGPVASGVTLDAVAPTVAELIGFERPFPEVRSGTAIDAVVDRTGAERPSLVVLVAWKGVGSADLESAPKDWPFVASLMADGSGTLDAETGSLPLDPTATMTTIGTGGPPAQHGITGTIVRNDEGLPSRAFDAGAPVHIIATLADDLEEADPATMVGLVGTAVSDRGLVGGGWYERQDRVQETIADAAAAPRAVRSMLSRGFGSDAHTDVLGVALQGPLASLDRWTRRIVGSARSTADALIVVAGTGGGAHDRAATPASTVVNDVEDAIAGSRPVVAAEAPGGVFLDQAVLTEQGITGQAVVDALLAAETPDGERMFADVFQGFAVSFARYC